MLLNLINDLLDLAKIENSSFNLNQAYFNLHNVIQKAVDSLKFSADQKKITIYQELEEENVGFFMQILGDQNRYLQILLNFISNAIKFTPENGKITVTTTLIDF